MEYGSPQLTPWVDFQAYMDRMNYENNLQQAKQANAGFGAMTADQGHYPQVGAMASKPGQVIYNPDGSTSSEKSFSVGMDFGTGGEKTALLRSIAPNQQGMLQQYSPAAALNMFRTGQNPAIGIFDNQTQADAAAKFRSENGGRNYKEKFDRTGMRNWQYR